MYGYSIKTVNQVIDSNTIDITVDLGFDCDFQVVVRLAGLISPDINSEDLEIRSLGFEAKDYIINSLKNAKDPVVHVRKKKDELGTPTYFVWIYINGDSRSLNDYMIECGYSWSEEVLELSRNINQLKQMRTKEQRLKEQNPLF